MKIALGFIVLSLGCLGETFAGEELALKPLAAPPESDGESFFVVEQGSVKIEGEVIREFALVNERVTVAYKNSTGRTISPSYTLRIYNRYGVLLGVDEVSPGLLAGGPRLESGDVGGDRLNVEWVDLPEIFKHSTIRRLPQDFSTPAWLSIAESNSKVGTEKTSAVEGHTETNVVWEGARAEDLLAELKTVFPILTLAVVHDGRAVVYHQAAVEEVRAEANQSEPHHQEGLRIGKIRPRAGDIPPVPAQAKKMEIRVVPTADKLRVLGLTMSDLGKHLREARKEGADAAALRGAALTAPDGTRVLVSDLAELREVEVRRPLVLRN